MAEDTQQPTTGPGGHPHRPASTPGIEQPCTDPSSGAGAGSHAGPVGYWGMLGFPPGAVSAPFGWAMPPSAVPVPPFAPQPASLPPATAAPAPAPPAGPLLPRLGLTAGLALDLVNAALAGGVRLLAGGVQVMHPGPCHGHHHAPHHGPHLGCGHHSHHCHGCDYCRLLGQEPAGCCDYRTGNCCS